VVRASVCAHLFCICGLCKALDTCNGTCTRSPAYAGRMKKLKQHVTEHFDESEYQTAILGLVNDTNIGKHVPTVVDLSGLRENMVDLRAQERKSPSTGFCMVVVHHDYYCRFSLEERHCVWYDGQKHVRCINDPRGTYHAQFRRLLYAQTQI
jgi:hypothetical protein